MLKKQTKKQTNKQTNKKKFLGDLKQFEFSFLLNQ